MFIECEKCGEAHGVNQPHKCDASYPELQVTRNKLFHCVATMSGIKAALEEVEPDIKLVLEALNKCLLRYSN